MGGVLDALLQRTLSSMAGYVPLPAIVKKVVSDHAGSSLGEFRHVILAMLDTYSYDTAIHRTAASLLFESLRTVVRERHTLKGAGVRVSAVGGFDLHPPRIAAADGPTGTRNASAAAAASAAGSPPEQRGGVFSVGGGGGGGGRSLAPHHPPVPSGLLGAVGSGVISVSSGGVAVVEHLGRGGSGGDAGSRNDEGDGDGDYDGSSGAGARRAAASPPPLAAAVSQQDASASLWRLRAARRRRQARGDKMRSLARWSAGEDTGPIRGGGGDRARGTIGHIPVMNRDGTKVSGRNGGGVGGGALGRDENGRVHQRGGPGAAAAAAAAGGAAANQYRREAAAAAAGEEEEQSRGRQALGWGSALQARAALALPASFLTKRT
ncbi:unnamed protein product [Ectocarpus sp. 8 AP-2014]